MATYRKNLAVGMTMIVALLLLGAMILLFGDAPVKLFQHSQIPIVLQCDNAEGVSPGSPVFYLGVNRGKVTLVRLAPDNSGVIIEALVSPPIPANVEGVIRPNVIGGSATLALVLVEDQPSGQLASGAVITARQGGTNLLPREFAELAKNLTELSKKLGTTIDDLNNAKLVNKVAATVDTANKTIARIGEVADEAKKVLGDEKLRGDVKETVANLKSVSENAKVIAKNLESFSTKLNKVSENVEKLTSDASVTLTKTGTRIDELSKDLGGRLEQLAVILDRFQSVAGKIDKGEGTAGKLINDPKLYESLVDTSQELNLTIKDLRRLVEQWEQEGVTLKLGGKK